MATFMELECRWRERTAPADPGQVMLIVARVVPEVHEVLQRARLDPELGLVGDRWSKPKPGQELDFAEQITLMNADVVSWLCGDDIPLHTPGDNFLVDFELGAGATPPGTRLRIGEALIEVSPKPHLGCKKFAQRFGPEALRWVNHKDHRSRCLRGVNGRVIEGGSVAIGDPIVRI